MAIITTKNKIGLECTYSEELNTDLKKIHGMDCEVLLKNMYGTNWNITKTMSLHMGHVFLKFQLMTNDIRDGLLEWEHCAGPCLTDVSEPDLNNNPMEIS